MNTPNEAICCPQLDPTLWDDKQFEWNNKQFIKDKICTLFFMPLNFGKVMKRMDKKVREANANVPEWLCLADHTSKWNMDMYLAVDKTINNAENTTITGKFYSKVYEGHFKDTGIWHKDFENILKTKGYNSKKIYMWYTTCPKCAKKYGKNYVVFIAEI